MRLNNVRLSFVVVVALGIVFASACGGDGGIVTPSLVLTPTSAQMKVGEKKSFVASGGSDYSWSLEPATCGVLNRTTGPAVEFEAKVANSKPCILTVNSSGRNPASANIMIEADTTEPPPPPPVVRASIGPITAVYLGDPACRVGCDEAVKIQPNADGCYVLPRQGTVQGLEISHPAMPGRTIRKTTIKTGSDGFENSREVREYPDESKIVGTINFAQTISVSHTQVGTYEFRLEEWGGDLPSTTEQSVFLRVCRP